MTDFFDYFKRSIGDFDFRISAKDEYGNVVTQIMSRHFDYPELQLQASTDIDKIPLGEKVHISAVAKGGDENYTYLYRYKMTTQTTYTTIADYSKKTEIDFTPPAIGKCQLFITVKDGQGKTVQKLLTVTVNDLPDSHYVAKDITTDNMSDFDKVLTIHDWIINKTKYDTRIYSSEEVPWSSYRSEGVFKYGVAVCDGYSKAFQELAELAGLTVNRVTGTAVNNSGITETHSWNQVKVDGKWYNIDVTWDDPISTDGDKLQYIYFLVPDSQFTDHTASGTHYTCTTAQPTAKISSYALQQDLKADPNCAYCENTAQLKTAMANFHSKGIDTFRLIYKTNLTDTSAIFKQIFAAAPSGCSKNATLEQWKLKGYYYAKVTLS